MSKRALTRASATFGVVLASVSIAATAYAMQFTSWSPAQKIDDIPGNHVDLNTAALDGCPIQAPDGSSLYMASNRTGSQGLDIWVATWNSATGGFGAPVNIGAPINTASDEFCPTPVRGNGLFFVSRKLGGCGLGDIYFTRHNPTHGWSEPENLGCAPNGPNSALDEQGPSRVELDGIDVLFFSRSTLPPGNSGEIFMSTGVGGSYGPATAVAELNDGSANDIQPNVRKDGLEIVFSSNRTGGVGGQDIWSATRASAADSWSALVNLGPSVNTGLGESRPSLSWDALELLFGRAGPVGTGEGGTGASDIYVTTREKSDD